MLRSIGLLQKASFKTTFFFSKKYTNKFIENVGQFVKKATFSEASGDRGQKYIETLAKHLKWSSFAKILRDVNLDV